MALEQTELDVRGYRGDALVYTYHVQTPPSTSLGLLLPGMGYGMTAPGLRYAVDTLAESSWDTFALETRYNTSEFAAATEEQQRAWLSADLHGAFQAAWSARPYERLLVVAKSLGTLGLSLLLGAGRLPLASRLVWLTPLLNRSEVVESMLEHAPRSLVVIGTADPHYQPDVLTALAEAGAELLVLEAAGHSFGVADDTPALLNNLAQIMTRLRSWAGRA
jgi:hypothetical protein